MRTIFASQRPPFSLYMYVIGNRSSHRLHTELLVSQLYLDEQHVEWMSERVLQHVLADLRPLCVQQLPCRGGLLIPEGFSQDNTQAHC